MQSVVERMLRIAEPILTCHLICGQQKLIIIITLEHHHPPASSALTNAINDCDHQLRNDFICNIAHINHAGIVSNEGQFVQNYV